MALEWDVSAVEDRQVKYPADEGGTINPVTYTLIMATMLVGIGEITGETAGEFYARLHTWEVLHGSFVQAEDEVTGQRTDTPITPEQVRDHIGLRTNVFPMETRAKWLKRCVSSRLTEYATEYQAAIETVPREVTG